MQIPAVIQHDVRCDRCVYFRTFAPKGRVLSCCWLLGVFLVATCLLSECPAQESRLPAASRADRATDAPEVTRVKEKIVLFNGHNLDGFTTWLQSTGCDDPDEEYSVADGTIHIAGRGMGYLATKKSYRDYHLSVEYRWGKRVDGSGFVRNSGILLHATGPDGNAEGIWQASIECQLAQGCEGDLIVIRGKDRKDHEIPVTLTSNTRVAEDGRTRWQPDGKKTVYAGKQFWWSKHEVGFAEALDTRGKQDPASRLGEWTRVDCICRADTITIKINGKTVNRCYDVYPSAGRILLENEKNEIYFRNFELSPLDAPE